MTEEQDVKQEESKPQDQQPVEAPGAVEPGQPVSETPPPAAPPIEQSMDEKEVEEGKVFAILSYVLTFLSIPFFLIPLIMRNNEFSLFHAKQCLMLWLAGLVIFAVSVPLIAICIGVILAPAGGIFLLVLTIIGLINAINGCDGHAVPWGCG
jgi:uncharacterized membrane protein